MSSLVRTLQKRIFKEKGYNPYEHNGNHGGFETVEVPNTDGQTIEMNFFKWPLLEKNFNEPKK